MKLKNWYEIRGPKFIWQRGTSLLERYDISPEKGIGRIKSCVAEMVALGCAPTLPTPGIIVERYPKFIHSLQEYGVEIAVHGYHHINLRDLPVAGAISQFMRAVRTFNRYGIEVRGFRCPYMGCSHELEDSLPAGVFEYGSNQAFYLGGAVKEFSRENKSLFFNTLDKFYSPKDASQKVCLPWMSSDRVEIPVCIPDDLQLYDGLQYDIEGIGNYWVQILNQTYLRGELFTLLFHTELSSLCLSAFGTLIRQAQQYQPEVWIARLRDISDWWREKSKFKVEITLTSAGLHLNFDCTPRATILVRGLDSLNTEPFWDGNYHKLSTPVLDIMTNPRPFVGIAANAPESTISFLRDQGYIVDSGDTARGCGIYLDNDVLCKLNSEVELINHIETSPAPLVRYWHWPNGAKCALSITGDLDALTLIDYASRIFIS